MKKLSQQEFLNKCYEVHGSKYNYLETKYYNMRTKIKIICCEHGEFFQKPLVHIQGQGCRKCGNSIISKKLFKGLNTFLLDACKVHGEKYDYSKVEYTGKGNKIKITCKTHGEFNQTPNAHLQGAGCPKCGGTIKRNKEDLINTFNNVHNNKYDYSLMVYKNGLTKIKILCPIHGVFEQIPNSHFNGSGCSKCNSIISKPEIEVQEFVKSLGFEIETNNRKILNGKELDIYIPKLNKAIEFNGMWWHYDDKNINCKQNGYHGIKSNLCREQGIRLLHVREDLWKEKRKTIENALIKFLNL